MTIILARLRPEHASTTHPPTVHAYRIPDDGNTPTLTAACGHELDIQRSERVNLFVGVPCTPCLLMTATQTHEVERVQEPPALPEVSASGTYAVGLRGERVTHRVPQRPIRNVLDGHSVVQTVCGVLARGPFDSDPHGRSCVDCEAMPERAIS